MLNKTKTVLITILILFNIFLVFNIYTSENAECTWSLDDPKIIELTDAYAKMIFDHAVTIPDFELNESIKLVNEHLEVIDPLIEWNGKVILVASLSNSCMDCLEAQFEMMKEFNDLSKDMAVVLLNTTMNEVRAMKGRFGLNCPFYVTESNASVSTIDIQFRPYYMRLGNNMELKLLFIPDKNFPKLSRDFLSFSL